MPENFDDLIKSVLEWGYARNLHGPELAPQFIKLVEEQGEVAAGIARGDSNQIIDGVGDMLVVLINLGACFARAISPDDTEEQLRIEQEFLPMCLNTAWKEIRSRQGETRDGVFVKEGDV